MSFFNPNNECYDNICDMSKLEALHYPASLLIIPAFYSNTLPQTVQLLLQSVATVSLHCEIGIFQSNYRMNFQIESCLS